MYQDWMEKIPVIGDITLTNSNNVLSEKADNEKENKQFVKIGENLI